MKIINMLLAIFIIFNNVSCAFAGEKRERFYYCGGGLNFRIPDFINKKPLV